MSPEPAAYLDATRERLAARYREILATGKVGVQRCRACRHVQFPPLPDCERCGSDDVAWEHRDGGRVVASYTGPPDHKGRDVRVAVVDVGGCRVPACVAPSAPMVAPGDDVVFVPPVAPRLTAATVAPPGTEAG